MATTESKVEETRPEHEDTSSSTTNKSEAEASGPSSKKGGAGGNAAANANYQSASLYVGDLSSDLSEPQLLELFKEIGPVLSVRVCRDAATRRSLGYAYVNFQNPADAERALDTLNFVHVRGNPIRLMWSHRDPTVRKSGLGNVFIKSLDKSIDNKALYDTFSAFGNILSCKVQTDNHGNSLGYGFVHFETQEAADLSIEKVNGMLLNDKKVFVGPFVRKQERLQHIKDELREKYKSSKKSKGKKKEGDDDSTNPDDDSTNADDDDRTTNTESLDEPENDEDDDDEEEMFAVRYTNLYVKNLDEIVDDEKLTAAFAAFGEVVNACVMKDDATGLSKGFGFVNFLDHPSAKKAVDALHDKETAGFSAPGRNLWVGRAQKKAERDAELRQKYEKIKNERASKYAGVNLYVKNLDEHVDEQQLTQEFAVYGDVQSVKIMVHDKTGTSRGFGFVCFKNQEAAARAQAEMNGKMLGSKPLYVSYAQRREERRAQLELEANHRAANGRMVLPPPHQPQGVPFPHQPLGMPLYGAPPQRLPPYGMYPHLLPQQRPRWVQQPVQGGMPQGGQPQGGPRGYDRGFPQGGPPPNALRGGPRPPNPPHFSSMAPPNALRGQGPPPQNQSRNGGKPYYKQGPQGYGNQGPMAPFGYVPQGQPMPQGMLPNAPMNPPPNQQGFKYTTTARNQQPHMQPMTNAPPPNQMISGQQPPAPQQPAPVQPQQQQQPPQAQGTPLAQEPLTATSLAQMDDGEAKNMLGERLFYVIVQHFSQNPSAYGLNPSSPDLDKLLQDLASKITGMLLEMDNGELLILLEAPDQLEKKVQEAMDVLKESELQKDAPLHQ